VCIDAVEAAAAACHADAPSGQIRLPRGRFPFAAVIDPQDDAVAVTQHPSGLVDDIPDRHDSPRAVQQTSSAPEGQGGISSHFVLSYTEPDRLWRVGERSRIMMFADAAWITALAGLVTSLAGLVWALRRRA
jgi:hypothetical protein